MTKEVIYYKPGNYYVYDYTTHQPLTIDGKKIESDTKGPLLNWLQKSILLLNYENKGDLAGLGLVNHKLAILRENIIVEKGQHTHYKVIEKEEDLSHAFK